MKQPEIKGVQILGVEIELYDEIEPCMLDLGAITLKAEDREFILYITES